MNTRLRIFLLCPLLAAASACGPLDDLNPPDPPDPPASSLAMDGMYQTQSAWDLGASLTADGIGGLVADMIVQEIVSAAGVPSALEDEARDIVADVIREPIRDAVSGSLPAELLPESGLMGELNAILASVEVTALLSLFETPDDPNIYSGTEVVESISLTYQASTIAISLPDLLDGSGAGDIAANLTANVAGPSDLDVSSHQLQIRLGRLVEMAIAEFALVADLDALEQQAAAAIDCANLVQTITGGADSFPIDVGGESFAVSVEQLDSGCQAMRAEVESYILGLFRIDTGVAIGGEVQVDDVDGDERVDTMDSAGSYSGELTNLPVPLPVPFTATMSATAL